MVALTGALESAVSGSELLKEEAIASGGIATLLAVLRILLESEQEAELGNKFKLHSFREPELLPNLLLALSALVRNHPESRTSLRQEGGLDLMLSFLKAHPLSESAVLAIQVLIDMGVKPDMIARALDSASLELGARTSSNAAQVMAIVVLEKLARTLVK